ncbi:MAG TPA: aminopeptidase P N-terminal domain-containing protein [Candidatus Synoicihabitans sp.]|nr:aminopeptidase P N-terminal domain-containing protein [Candidatus Synoicihabitans sp.]
MPFSEDVLNERRARVASALELDNAILVIGAGAPIPLPEGTDQTYPYRAHAEFFYLTGLECPHAVLAFDPQDGAKTGWRCFVPSVTEDERVWEGRAQPPGERLDQFAAWLGSRRHRPIVGLGASIPQVERDPIRSHHVRELFHHTRRIKDPAEIELLRRVASATAAGYRAIQPHLYAGITERALQIELEAAFARAGGARTGYGTIVGIGSNAAILHFEPSARAAREGEFVLIDAGAEIDRYVCDVTRTYVIGAASGFQHDLYQIVLDVHRRAINRCRAGREWKDVHLRAATELTEGLIALGLLRGDAESLVEQEAHLLFFPHGLGHLVGLGVRDASGTEPGRTKDPRPSLRNLRTDLPLRPGYVITVEPGLYFIRPLLEDPARRERFRSAIDWDRVDQHLDVGGVRIEDNVLVTEGDPEVLTEAIPKGLQP